MGTHKRWALLFIRLKTTFNFSSYVVRVKEGVYNIVFNKDLARMYAYLPIKLSQLSKINPNAALKILQDWGDGRKDIRKLWETTVNALDEADTESEGEND